MNIINLIKQNVKLEDIFNLYNLDYYNGAICCPFPDHYDIKPSCLIKYEWFECYSCGRRGDVIDFVEGMNCCDKVTAINWIVQKFNLILLGNITVEDLKKTIDNLCINNFNKKEYIPDIESRKLLAEQLEKPINDLWKLYSEKWQAWVIFDDVGVWENEIILRIYKLKKIVIYGDWLGLVKIREFYDKIYELAKFILNGRNDAHQLMEGEGFKPDTYFITDFEAENRKCKIIANYIAGIKNHYNVNLPDLIEVFDKNYADKIRLFNSINSDS